jgi:hypothetical protein
MPREGCAKRAAGEAIITLDLSQIKKPKVLQDQKIQAHNDLNLGEVMDKLAQHNIKLIVFDFDFTILKIHSFAQRITAEQVATRDLESDFKDLSFFQSLVSEARTHSIEIAVASFGRFPVIKAYMQRAFPCQEAEVDILTPGCFENCRDGQSMENGKNQMLEKYSERKYLVNSKEYQHQVLFFDDDESNISLARQSGWLYSFHTPTGMTKSAFAKACHFVLGEGNI